MGSRLELHEELCEVLGSRNAYFQGPGKDRMSYPAVVYKLENVNVKNADNKHYLKYPRYSLTIIDRDPDSTIWSDMMEHFKYCYFDRSYTADNLNHWTLSIYY